METVTIGLGTNLGDKEAEITAARQFLSRLSTGTVNHAPMYKTEPVGPSEYYYYNSVSQIESNLTPQQFITQLKHYEISRGRPVNPAKWSARIIDLDIIGYGNLILHSKSLHIPHTEYRKRLFVLKPLFDIDPGWTDPETNEHIVDLVKKAPEMEIVKIERSRLRHDKK